MAATIKVVELHVVLRGLKWQVRFLYVNIGMFGSWLQGKCLRTRNWRDCGANSIKIGSRKKYGSHARVCVCDETVTKDGQIIWASIWACCCNLSRRLSRKWESWWLNGQDIGPLWNFVWSCHCVLPWEKKTDGYVCCGCPESKIVKRILCESSGWSKGMIVGKEQRDLTCSRYWIGT